ncbi:MAG: PucR family transcriptional regulator [Pedococcus sp.]
MPVPLPWLLAQSDLALRLVVGPAAGVHVDWAHSIELEDPSPWLSGGELLLTTGLRLPRTLAEQTAYVHRLREVGVAALAFGTGVRYQAVPKALVVACAEVGLPLVEIPLPTPFIAVTQRIAQQLATDQQESLQRIVAFQQSLTRATLRNGPDGLVTGLARELEAQVVLVDEHVTAVGVSPAGQPLAAEMVRDLQTTPSSRTVVARTGTGGRGVIEIHTLRGHSAHRGWLCLWSDRPLTPGQRLLVHHAASLATLHLDRPRELEEARGAVGATVLGLLLEGAPAAAPLVAHLRHLGFGNTQRVRVLWADGAAADAPGAVQACLTAAGITHAVRAEPGGVAVLVGDTDVQPAVDRLSEVVSRRERTTVLGVSAAVAQELTASARAQAREAAQSARRSGMHAAWFDQLTLGAVLADPDVRERVRVLTLPSLAPLLDQAGGDAVLLRSLETFLEHHGVWESAARALSVHRHTLRSRITRVEELTGLDLDVADTRVVLRLALATL